MGDFIGEYGIASGVLLLFFYFLRGLLRLGGKYLGRLVDKHIETMDAFQENQTEMVDTLSEIRSRMERDAILGAERHAALIERTAAT